jgi:hypothetical protein
MEPLQRGTWLEVLHPFDRTLDGLFYGQAYLASSQPSEVRNEIHSNFD